jgi:hypothetical protein
LVTVIDVVELGTDIEKSPRNGGFLEKRDAQNLQEFVEADVEGETLLHDGDEERVRNPVPCGRRGASVNGELVNRAYDAEWIPGHIALQSEGAEIHFQHAILHSLDER